MTGQGGDIAQFILLGCSYSNLADESYPFVVAVAEGDGSGFELKFYVLNGWQNIRKFFPDSVREEVLLFLLDLRHYDSGDSAVRFFGYLKTLCVGPIRFVAFGQCASHELDVSISETLDSRQSPVFWPESFRALPDENSLTDDH